MRYSQAQFHCVWSPQRATRMPRHHVQPASSSPPCFSFSTDSLGADITVFLIYWFPVCRSPWKRNRPRAASLDPSVHSCLYGPQGAWHIRCAQECLLRAHVTPRDHRRHSPPAEGGFRLQAAHWERGLQAKDDKPWLLLITKGTISREEYQVCDR